MKVIENEEQILFFLNKIKGIPLEEDETFFFKSELTEVIFKPKSKRKRNAFCKQMDMDLFDEILKDLELPFRITQIKESPNTYIVEKKEE